MAYMMFRFMLVEEIFQTNLHSPALAIGAAVRPCLGGIGSVQLTHGEIRCTTDNLVHFQNLSVARIGHGLSHTPTRVEEVAYILNVKRSL